MKDDNSKAFVAFHSFKAPPHSVGDRMRRPCQLQFRNGLGSSERSQNNNMATDFYLGDLEL